MPFLSLVNVGKNHGNDGKQLRALYAVIIAMEIVNRSELKDRLKSVKTVCAGFTSVLISSVFISAVFISGASEGKAN